MNSVHISNQICNQCRIDHWIQKYMWWWSLFWWSHSVLVFNENVMYNNDCALKIARTMSHCKLRRHLFLESQIKKILGGRIILKAYNTAKGYSIKGHNQHWFVRIIRNLSCHNKRGRLWRGTKKAQRGRGKRRIQVKYDFLSFLTEHLCVMGTSGSTYVVILSTGQCKLIQKIIYPVIFVGGIQVFKVIQVFAVITPANT